MNKAFEKILEKLEELRQEQIEELCEHKDFTREMQSMRGYNILQDAKKIVQEVAEEYNNGWIPCSERLPELETEVLICTKYKEMTISTLTKPDIFWKDEEGNIVFDVIAWQQLPEPYQPNGE